MPGNEKLNRRTAQLTVGSITCLAGLGLARVVAYSNSMIFVGAICVGILAFSYSAGLKLIAVIVVASLVGLARGNQFMHYSAAYQQHFRKQITVTATADNDAIYGKQSQLSFDVVNVMVTSPSRQLLKGKVKVEGLGVPMVYRGDQVQIQGSLAPTKGSAQAKFSFAKLRLLRRGVSPIDSIRRRFIAGLGSALPEPEASFGAGLLLGQRSTIPKDISDQLSATGLTHLVAVSGYNLTIIIVAVRKFLGKASKFQSTICAAALMLLFTLVTGFSASIVRASLVSSLSLVAWYYGRRFRPALLILGTAAVMALWNPFYLWSDIGWYLSFLAFFGVLLIAPLLAASIGRGKPPKLVGALLAETIAAQIMTLPIIMYIFGRVSIIGLLANVFVVPLVPLAMLLTLTAGLSGMLYPPLAGWFALPAKLLLTYMVDLVGLLSRLPHAQAQKQISLYAMLLGYGLILLVSFVLWRFLTSRKWIDYDKITE